MQQELIYRQVKLTDFPALKEVAVCSYGQYGPMLSPEGWQHLEEALHNEENLRGIMAVATGFVCETEGIIAGMAFFVPSGNPTDIYEAEWCYIRYVGVLPAYAGRGIAKALTAICLAHARQAGETYIALHTSELMHAARHIYEQAGFRQLREIPPRFGMRYWLYGMSLDS